MINVYKRFFLFFVLAFGWLFFVLWWTDNVQLTLEIKWIWIRHWTPDNLNLWTIPYSIQEQEITWQFTSWFWVEDLLWLATWHYTTIQCDGLYWSDWSIITWVYLKNWNIYPVKLLGNTWSVFISTNLNNYNSIYNPVVYIYKTSAQSNVWLANRYQDIPTIKVIVPPNTTAGDYSWTIVFSLYMNDN